MSEQITVILPRMLAPDAGGTRTLAVPAEQARTAGQLLTTLAGRYPLLGRRLTDETGTLRRFVNLYVGGNDVRLDEGLATPIAAGQEVLIIQSVAGG